MLIISIMIIIPAFPLCAHAGDAAHIKPDAPAPMMITSYGSVWLCAVSPVMAVFPFCISISVFPFPGNKRPGSLAATGP